MKAYYKSSNHDFNLLHGDTFELLPQFEFKFDMIFADPPYFLSSGGISVQSGKVVCVDKGDWDRSMSPEEINEFNLKWLSLCREKLKDNGTIWISGTYHNIFSVANCLTQLGYKILNVITWAKTNPPPNISCRYFTYSTEFVIWARKKEKVAHYYNYELMKHINGDKQMTDVWRLPAIAPWEKSCGKHPTQKPLGLLSRIIMASTKPGAWILDPFAGSSTTGIAANLLGRRFLGIEREKDFAVMSKARREEIEDGKTFSMYKRKISDVVKAEDTQTDCFLCGDSLIEPLPFLGEETSDDDAVSHACKDMESGGKRPLRIRLKKIPRIMERNELVPNPEDRIMCVKVGKVRRESLYEMARKYWKVDIRRVRKATHVLAIVNGVVEEVYTPMEWKHTEEPKYMGRCEFQGVVDENSDYIGRSVASYYGRSQNPVKYINM
ncbi:MAG: hypothetical protein IJ914_02645 [Prevotella sp.]|nr:hypothetical protein [Prevotella sp.]